MESTPVAPLWDFLWNATVEEGREKSLLRHAFTMNTEEVPFPKDIQYDAVHVAESAVKVRSYTGDFKQILMKLLTSW